MAVIVVNIALCALQVPQQALHAYLAQMRHSIQFILAHPQTLVSVNAPIPAMQDILGTLSLDIAA